MKRLKAIFLAPTSLAVLLASSCAVEQEFTLGSTSKAILRGELKQALALYETAAQEAEKKALSSQAPQSHWETATTAYREAARAAREAGQLQKSVLYGEKALQAAEKLTYGGYWLWANNELINAYRAVRNFEKVKERISNGFEKFKTLTAAGGIRPLAQLSWQANLYWQLGNELLRQRDYDKAAEAFSQSFHFTQAFSTGLQTARRGDRQLFASSSEFFAVQWSRSVLSLASLGHAYRQAGKLELALEEYRQALKFMNALNLKYYDESDLYAGMGEVYFRRRNFPHALEHLSKAMILAENQQRPAAISSASVRIGNVFQQTGKTTEAIEHYHKAIRQIESIRSLLQSEEYRQSYFEGAVDAYISMIDVLLSSGKAEEAFNYSERARSRVFLDILGTRVQLSRLRGGLVEEERALQEQIAAIRARLGGVEEDEEENVIDRGSLQRELSEAERAYNGFLARVRREDKEQASLMTVEPLTLKEVQELLDPGTTLVEYFVTNTHIHVWVVEKERSQYLSVLLRREDLARQVKAVRESIYALGEKEKFNEVSTSLHKSLIQPLLPHITGKELIIVPHDVLHYLPFHALVSPDGHYLIEKYPIYYLSSASLLQFTKEKRRAKGERVLAFGNPDLGDPNKDLKFAELEAQEVKTLYPYSTVLVRKEATEGKSKGLSPQHDILHFATHAELKEEDPLSSAILLAKDGKEDGRLEVREIFGMDLKASLVVLSACDTALGKLSSGDELVGLTRAFIYAGTPSVMASLWKVDDASTASLMGSFYRNFKTMSKAEALRQAQLELIRGQASSDLLARRGVGGIGKLGEVPEAKSDSPGSVPVSISVSTSHPYFWAPFILVGDGK